MAKVINISMPDDLVALVNHQAKLEDRPRSAIFREALRIYLAIKEEEQSARDRVYSALKEVRSRISRSKLTEDEVDARIARAIESVRTQRSHSTPKGKKNG